MTRNKLRMRGDVWAQKKELVKPVPARLGANGSIHAPSVWTAVCGQRNLLVKGIR